MPRCSRPTRSRCSCSPRRGKSSASPWRRRSPATASTKWWRRCAHLRWSTASRSWTSATPRPRPTPSVSIAWCGRSRRRGAREDVRRALMAALAAVYPADGYRNPASWPRCAPLTPHLLASCESEPDDGAASAQCASLLNMAAKYFYGRAAYAVARPLLERALAIRERTLGPEHPDTATSLHNLAESLWVANRPSEAEPLIRRELAIDEKSLAPVHPDVAIRLNALARLLRATNRLGEAEPLLRRALSIFEKSLGADHPSTVTVRNNLSRLRPKKRMWWPWR